MICMIYMDLYTKYKHWATRYHSAATAHDLDNAVLLLSYVAGLTASTLSDVVVCPIAIHIHIFIFTVKITWALDVDGSAGIKYKLLFPHRALHFDFPSIY